MFTRQSNGEFIVTNARENIWGTIDCDVTIEETGEVIPFTATPDDPLEYGRELYTQLNSNRDAVAPVDENERYEIMSGIARAERDRKLQATDWTQGADSPLSDAKKAEWATYRQALRDITDTYPDPTSKDQITWPSKPE